MARFLVVRNHYSSHYDAKVAQRKERKKGKEVSA